MAKIFLSTLGTGSYKESIYKLYDVHLTTDTVTFIQEALVSHFCHNWTAEDKITVLLTKDAKEQSWDCYKEKCGGGHREGLKSALERLRREKDLQLQIETIDIPNGKNEQELWECFGKICDSVKEGDEVILDVTHGFRSLPMLMSNAVNYLRVAKSVKILGIYYGAFDAGDKKEEGVSPVFDLLAFSSLSDWASASADFLKYGRADKLVEATNAIIKSERKDVYINQKSEPLSLKEMREISNFIKKQSELLLGARATEFCDCYPVSGKNCYQEIGSKIDILESQLEGSQPLRYRYPILPLVGKIGELFKRFSSATDDIGRGLVAVEWALDTCQHLQAVIMFQELLISVVLRELKTVVSDELPNTTKEERDEASRLINQFSKPNSDKLSEDTSWKEQKVLIEKVTDRLRKSGRYEPFVSLCKLGMNDERNNLMHGGFAHDGKKNAEEVAERVMQNLKALNKWLKE